MFDEVLKFGSLIVDALVEYEHPVFVYLPPHSTLRGGAWVVIDSTINSEVMEMYADKRARGGVLEAPGTVSIKYRKADLVKTAYRLDPELQRMRARIDSMDGSREELQEIKQAMLGREQRLLGTYLQIATHFADLHDTPGRMSAKNAINGVVPWRRARSFFYWRLRRRLAEFALRRAVCSVDDSITRSDAAEHIRNWYILSVRQESKSQSPEPAWKQYALGGQSRNRASQRVSISTGQESGDSLWDDDRRVLSWLNDSGQDIDAKITALRHDVIQQRIAALSQQNPRAALAGLVTMMGQLSAAERVSLVSEFQEQMRHL